MEAGRPLAVSRPAHELTIACEPGSYAARWSEFSVMHQSLIGRKGMWLATGLKFSKQTRLALRTGDWRPWVTQYSRTKRSRPGGARSTFVTFSRSRRGAR